ncbi:MAG: nuclear transport factor 2 family protein [Arenibacter sp.]|jgi:uncharacterized lipoprotein NlpE involved in copper resistance
MVKSRTILILSTVFILMGCKQNANKSEKENIENPSTVQQESLSIEEVQQAVSIFNKAMVDPTVELMEGLCADELTYGHSSGLIQNKAEFIDDIVNGPFDFISLEAPEQTIHISGDTAIVRHIFLAKGTNAGEAVDVRIGNVQVYQKDKDGGIKLLARQAYKLPN